ncbi:MAG: CGNR zinc finger domain-containing protein [Pseudomonadota bacterium]
MTGFHWDDHHFINRQPALDFANMVVWRGQPGREEDRGRSIENLAGWALFAGLKPPASSVERCIAAREAIDGYFRSGSGWPALATLYAEILSEGRDDFLATILHEAMTLAFSPDAKRVRVCGNCGWLFIDRTRNANKRWCITGVCGSRAKARRYYARKKQQLGASG